MGNEIKTAFVVCLWLAILLFLPVNTHAIAIAPGSVDFAFEPNSEQAFDIHIINNDDAAADVTLYVNGGLASYVDFPEQTIKMKPNEIKIMRAKLRLPNALPADPTARIGASVFAGPSVVAAVESIITVKRPVPKTSGNAGAEIEILGIKITRFFGSTSLDISIKNTGNTGTEVYAEASIDSDAGKGNVKTGSKIVQAGQQQTLSAPLSGVLAQAREYKADVVIYFGQNTVKKSVHVSNSITGGSIFNVPAGLGRDVGIIAAIIIFIVIDLVVLFWHRNRIK